MFSIYRTTLLIIVIVASISFSACSNRRADVLGQNQGEFNDTNDNNLCEASISGPSPLGPQVGQNVSFVVSVSDCFGRIELYVDNVRQGLISGARSFSKSYSTVGTRQQAARVVVTPVNEDAFSINLVSSSFSVVAAPSTEPLVCNLVTIAGSLTPAIKVDSSNNIYMDPIPFAQFRLTANEPVQVKSVVANRVSPVGSYTFAAPTGTASEFTQTIPFGWGLGDYVMHYTIESGSREGECYALVPITAQPPQCRLTKVSPAGNPKTGEAVVVRIHNDDHYYTALSIAGQDAGTTKEKSFTYTTAGARDIVGQITGPGGSSPCTPLSVTVANSVPPACTISGVPTTMQSGQAFTAQVAVSGFVGASKVRHAEGAWQNLTAAGGSKAFTASSNFGTYTVEANVSNSLDQSINCSVSYNIPDPGRWYQANSLECTSYCQGIGKQNVPAPDGTNAKCVSGEQRAPSAMGVITMTYGCWGSCSQANANHSSSTSGFCYAPGQKHDYDSTDRTVGCYCR